MNPDDWIYYHFCGKYHAAVRKSGITKSLRYQLSPLEIRRPPSVPLKMILCRSASEIPENGVRLHTGRYKGIPWQMGLSEPDETGSMSIYFFARLFPTFLFLRFVLMPYLKRKVVEDGGFSLIGSAFEYSNKRYVLFGYPGSGKTKRILQATSRGARLLGDSEILVWPDGTIQGAFRNLELRMPTVRNGAYWNYLTAAQKCMLFGYQMISQLTFHVVSFNLAVPYDEFGICWSAHSGLDGIHFIYLDPIDRIEKMAAGEMIAKIRTYEMVRRSYYRDIIYTVEHIKQSENAMEKIFNRCALWRCPLGTILDDMFALKGAYGR